MHARRRTYKVNSAWGDIKVYYILNICIYNIGVGVYVCVFAHTRLWNVMIMVSLPCLKSDITIVHNIYIYNK